MSLKTVLKDTAALTTGLLQYSANLEVLQEFPHFMHDLVLGAKREPKDSSHFYLDLHAHLRDTERITDIAYEAHKRVDGLAIVTRTIEANKGHLTFDKALEKLDFESVEHRVLSGGRIIYLPHLDFYLFKGTEVYTKENQGVVMVGNNKEFQGKTLSLEDSLKASENMGAFCFLDHPFSVVVPVISFRYPTQEEMKMKQRWFETYHPVIEIGNHQNTLWMYPSNVLARKMARKFDLPSIANSDTHFNVKDVGLSRTKIPKNCLDYSGSSQDLIDSLNFAFSQRITQIESGYASIWSFGKHMIIPKLRRIIGIKQ